MKKIGIVCDNYKLDKFKETLTNAGFKFTLEPFVTDTTSIIIHTQENRVKEVKKICEDIEKYFKEN